MSLSSSAPNPTGSQASDLRVMGFELCGRVFALPLADRLDCPYPVVERVVMTPEIDSSGPGPYQLLHWDQRDLLVLHLHRLLQPLDPPQPRFMLLIRSQAKGSNRLDYYGIPIPDPPGLLTLPPDTLRPLPMAYRHLDPLRLARYMAVLPHQYRQALRADDLPTPELQDPLGEMLVFLLEIPQLVRAAQSLQAQPQQLAAAR